MATAHVFTQFIKSIANKESDLDSDTLKVMLATASWTPNQDTHQYKSDVTNEVSGTGYTAGGASLGSVTWTKSGHVYTLDAADVSWVTSTITARYAVIYDSSPSTDATRPIIGYIDFGTNLSTSGTTFSITWDATGILVFTGA